MTTPLNCLIGSAWQIEGRNWKADNPTATRAEATTAGMNRASGKSLPEVGRSAYVRAFLEGNS